MSQLDAALAGRFARLALGHLTQEYPNKLDHVMAGPEDVQSPRALHPVFYGSFDWHSCVHGYWLLARVLKRFPESPLAEVIRAQFDSHLTAEKLAAERAYLARPFARGFERPYGWAWALKLQAELARLEGPWAARFAPLADDFANLFKGFLPLSTYAIRTGTHYDSAFALRLAADYAQHYDSELMAGLEAAARRWFGADADCPAWGEPGGDAFLSPALTEAAAMKRLLPAPEFAEWFARYLPRLAEGAPATLFTPASVSDRSDGKIAHLDGLNLSRAWCWRELAADLPEGPTRQRMLAAAEAHLAAGLPHVAGDYMGEHWLASFALLALDA